LGKPLENATSPDHSDSACLKSWFYDRFSIVERNRATGNGKRKLRGELQFQQMLPIRGLTKLLVDITPQVANAFTVPANSTLAVMRIG